MRVPTFRPSVGAAVLAALLVGHVPESGAGPEPRAVSLREDTSPLRVMEAFRAEGRKRGAKRAPVVAPWHLMLADGDPTTFVPTRESPPPGSGLRRASSEIFDVRALQAAGFEVVTWTVNEKPRMLQLLALGVDGIITDRPDRLREVVEAFDADGDGRGGDLLDASGLIDPERFDAQGHRGGRDLRPENTLPAMEVALDHLMSTLELDVGLSRDRVPILSHDPELRAEKCRRVDGVPLEPTRIRDLDARSIQARFVCDGLLAGRAEQTRDHALSPVTLAFLTTARLPDAYTPPTLVQVFEFVRFYARHYGEGAGAAHPDARRRAANAARVRFNIETKLNPRAEFAERTLGPRVFARVVGDAITRARLAGRADVQSFDFRTLVLLQVSHHDLRPVFLFGDFPVFEDRSLPGSDDGTNLQNEGARPSPWMAGQVWPYREP